MFTSAFRRINKYLGRWNLSIGAIPIWLLGMFVVLLWAAPFLWMVSTSFKPVKEVMSTQIDWIPRHVILGNYITVLASPLARWTLNSVIVSVTSTFLSVLFGAMAGYALGMLNFPGKGIMFAVILASLMIPGEMTIVPLYIGFLKTHLVNDYPSLILPTIASVLCVYIFRQFFLNFPSELEDAARMDGADRFTFFWRIAIPLARAPLIASTILIFSQNWNSFLWPLLVTFTEDMKTMPVGVAEYTPVIGSYTQVQGFGPAMAAVTLLSLPSLLVFFVLHRYFIEGISRSGIKG
jgi:multiple sugar transport system permease protein